MKMSKIRRKKDKERLVLMLETYRKEKCLGPRNCKTCAFSINNDGCALNLVIHSIEYDLSSNKEESDAQWKKLLYGNHDYFDQMVMYAESHKNSQKESSHHVSLKNFDLGKSDTDKLDYSLGENMFREVPYVNHDIEDNERKEYKAWKKRK